MAHLNANAREWKPSFGAAAPAAATQAVSSPVAAAPPSPTRQTAALPSTAATNSSSNRAKDASWRLGHAATAYRIKGTERVDPQTAAGEPECGPFRCWHPIAATQGTVWNRSVASQLFTSTFPTVKSVGDEQPCTSQGFVLTRGTIFGSREHQEYAMQLARSPGILLSFTDAPGPLDWTTLVDAMLLHRPAENAENGGPHSAANIVIEAIGFFTIRRCDYMFLVATGAGVEPSASSPSSSEFVPPPQVPCASLATLATRFRRQLPRVQRVSTWQSLLRNVLTVVSLPRSAVVVVVEEGSGEATSIDAVSSAVKSVQVGRHLPAETRVVHLPPYHQPNSTTAASVASSVQKMHCDVACTDAPHPIVNLLVLRVPKSLSAPADYPNLEHHVTAHAASEYLRLTLQVLQQFVLLPGAAIDARPGISLNWHTSGLTEQPCVVRLPPTHNTPAPQLMSELTQLLWPLPTSPSPPTLLPRRTGLPSFFDPIPDFGDFTAVAAQLQEALAQRAAAGIIGRPTRLLRSNYLTFLTQSAALADGSIAYRRPFGSRVYVIAIPSRVTMPEGAVSISWSLYISDAVASVVASLPAVCMTSIRPLPDGGVLVLEGYLCASHLGADQWKIVITDVVQLEGQPPPSNFADRVAVLTQLLEEDVKFCFRHPHGVALVRSCFVPAADAFEALCSASAPMVDYAHCGLVVRAASSSMEPWYWCPPQSNVVWFRAGPSARTANGDERIQLRLHTERGQEDYRGEYVDVPPLTIHRRAAEGDLLQCSLCVDADGCHWWEAIRVCSAAEFAAAFLVSPLCPLSEGSSLHDGYSIALRTQASDVDTLIGDAHLSESEVALLLRASLCVCRDCGTITDDGHRDSGTSNAGGSPIDLGGGEGPFRCMECWNSGRGLSDCRGCGATLVIGHCETSDATGRYFCDECWIHFDALARAKGDSDSPSSARDWAWLSKTVKEAAHYATVAQASAAMSHALDPLHSATNGSGVVDWSTRSTPLPAEGASLSLQLPATFAATLLVARRYITEECARVIAPGTVLDLCCGHDAPIAFWARTASCHGYLGVDLSATAVRSAESYAARSLAPSNGYLPPRLASALRTTYTVVCGDCMIPGFWEQHLPRCLPKPCDVPNLVYSLITCFRPLPLLRIFAEGQDAQGRFFRHLAEVAAPGAVVVLTLFDLQGLRDRAQQSEVSCSAVPGRDNLLRLTFRGAAVGSELNTREVEVPLVLNAHIIQSATDAGFAHDVKLLPGDALGALQRATRTCSPITTLKTSGSAIGPAVTRVEKYWTTSAAATAPIIVTDGCEAFLHATKFLVLRRR